ncbi:RICIN domain-containing protein [Bacillus thuringiensis]|nr:RICIN domain-containing protein [Bacillus thuringiensis]
MKFLSKKTMTGLFAGAMALTIFAPASQAATPEKDRYYTINLKANQSIVWDVSRGSTDNDRAILLWNGDRGDNEQFIFFPLDGEKYAIVNKNSGKPVSIGGNASFGNSGDGGFGPNALNQKNWTGAATEQWYLRDKGSNYYEIVNQGNGKVASWGGMYLMDGWADYVDLDEANPSDSDRVFQINYSPSGIKLPTLPAVGTRPNAPDYNPNGSIDQQLPQASGSVVVGASLIPSIMVKDNGASDYTKIHNSPYYVLVKEEYWERVRSEIIPAGSSSKYTVKTGVSIVDQQKMTDTLSMNFGADLGFKFGDTSASLKYGISKTLQTEVSKTSTDSKEETEEKTITSISGKNTGFTAYQLVTKYTLKRTDGSTVSDPWSVRDKNQTLVRTITN